MGKIKIITKKSLLFIRRLIFSCLLNLYGHLKCEINFRSFKTVVGCRLLSATYFEHCWVTFISSTSCSCSSPITKWRNKSVLNDCDLWSIVNYIYIDLILSCDGEKKIRGCYMASSFFSKLAILLSANAEGCTKRWLMTNMLCI